MITTFSSDTDTLLECDASWGGPSIPFTYPILVEVSSPTATAAPTRPPDTNGWYNHPVGISFSGSGYSGIATCSPTNTTYSGPGAANALVTSSCTDPAGKTATASTTLNYDPTPPTITGATPSRAPDSNGYYTHPVTFQFTGVDGISGIGSCDTVTYSGPTSGNVIGGCRDNAGNYATISVPVNYEIPTPVASVARAGSTIRLHWKKVPHATYYNVQIYRGNKKVLSTWPVHTTLVLKQSWKFAGHRYKLKPGSYRWYVWPGYGSRKAARYGRRMVSQTFRVPKPV